MANKKITNMTSLGAVPDTLDVVPIVDVSDISTASTGETKKVTVGNLILDGAQTLTNKTLTSPVINTGVSGTAVLDDDSMATASSTTVATSESIKAYVDTQLTGEDLDFAGDSGTGSVDLDSQSLTIDTGANLTTAASSQTLTVNLDTTITGLTSVTSTDFVGDITGDLTGNADTVTNGVYTTNNLSVLAATTSAQLAGVISDETGSGSLVFATSPTLVTPVLGTPASGALTNCTFPTLNQDTTGTAATVTGATQAAITSAANLATVGTIGTGVWQGTAIAANFGGTGTTSYVVGDLLYADSTTTVAKLAASTDGHVLTSTGSGSAPAWEAASGGGGGTPAGSDTEIQFNDSGSFGASSGLTFDGSVLKSSATVDGAKGVWGLNTTTSPTGTNTGVYGEVSGDGSGVSYALRATAAGAVTNGYGLYAVATGASTTSYGVWGEASGAGTTNYGAYFKATGATNNYGLVVASGNSGFGTTVPTEMIHCVGTVLATTGFVSKNTDGDAYFKAWAGGSSDPRIQFTVDGATDYVIGLDNSDDDALKFCRSGTVGNTTQMTITSGGMVGFGTAVPSQRIHVAGNAIVTGLMRMGSGSEASPAYQFVSDTNTGIWNPSSDVFAISTAATERLRITSGGDVKIEEKLGVGRTAASATLEVQGTSLFVDGTATFQHTSSNLQVDFTANNSTILNFTNGESGTDAIRTNASLKFDTGGANERLRITDSGQVQQPVESSSPASSGGETSFAVDFSKSNLQKLTLDASTDTLTLTSSSLAEGRTVRLYVDASSASLSTLNQPSDWTRFGDDVSWGTASGNNIYIEMTSWADADSNVTSFLREALS